MRRAVEHVGRYRLGLFGQHVTGGCLMASTGPSSTGQEICRSPSACSEPGIERAPHLAYNGSTMAVQWQHNGTGGDMSMALLATNRPHLARQVRLEWDPVRQRHVLLAPE